MVVNWLVQSPWLAIKHLFVVIYFYVFICHYPSLMNTFVKCAVKVTRKKACCFVMAAMTATTPIA